MKSLIYALVWTTLFVVFGIYVNNEIYSFTDDFTSKIDIIENYIKEDDWESAQDKLQVYHKNFHENRLSWYKLLNHEYFDTICVCLENLNNSIYCKDKSMSLEQTVKIKATLINILESEKFDLNHIF
ncbi:MAG: DUF4363 family protein [Romboutsia sp.]|uniref:DUF4363 family protein n=1 Tax=Romboutsia sp. TaxID=1965302 RepID=UPI003F371737